MNIHASEILCFVSSGPAPLPQAVFLAETLGANLHVVPLYTAAGSTVSQDDLLLRVEDATTDGAHTPPIVVPDVRPKRPDDVRQYAADHEIDLVVADTPSSDGPVAPLSNTTTSLFLERLDLPVFLTTPREESASIERVVAPTDFSAHALDALQHAAALARLYDVPIEVLHVIESIPYVALTRTDRLSLGPNSLSEHRCERQIEAFLREGHVSDVPTRTHVAYGSAADRIGTFANSDQDTLLVMSSHGTANQPDEPLGTVAKRTLMQTTCAVFLLRSFGPSLLQNPSRVEQRDASDL